MNPLTHAALTARTSLRLGLADVAAVLLHRIAERGKAGAGGIPLLLPPGPWFDASPPPPPAIAGRDAIVARGRRIAGGELECFGGRWVSLGVPFRWRENILSDGSDGSDIKGIWEASRFGWAVALARAHRLSPDEGLRDRLEQFVEDWLIAHPPFAGPNWSCGQEASLRVLHLLLANFILTGSSTVSPRLGAVVSLHLERVERTLGYARAQRNNHATSEAAALFIGGGVLAGDPRHAAQGQRWQRLGRDALERAVADLVMPDGGFAQYSVNYHRLMLDTLSQVEFWRRRLGAAPFSSHYSQRARAAVEWLGAVTSEKTGEAPNLGHNDGAHVFRLADTAYSDMRPTLSLAAALFLDAVPPRDAYHPEPLQWLELTPPGAVAEHLLTKRSRLFKDWGLALMSSAPEGGTSYAFVRYPVRRFRPAQADMLHMDLWDARGRNLLIDAGTFSYADAEGQRRFSSVTAHNMVSFDDGEPMRRIGRFLYADWPHADLDEALWQSSAGTIWVASYKDYRGITHRRQVAAQDDLWMITDHISGFRDHARLRWHLPVQPVRFFDHGIETDDFMLTVTSPSPGLSSRMEDSAISKTYGSKEAALAFVAELPAGSRLFTTTIAMKR